mmetsp:Transcript_71299/g.133363  ORF Transcript_71299/g.133363 Transcript_71299/m.133363 type:complete len:147 (+) Transcript_71299:75-515(+)
MALLKAVILVCLASTGVFLQGCGKDNGGGSHDGNTTTTTETTTTTSSPNVPAMCTKYLHPGSDCSGSGTNFKDMGEVSSQDACCELCSTDSTCYAWVFYKDTTAKELHHHCVIRMAACEPNPNLELVMGLKKNETAAASTDETMYV